MAIYTVDVPVEKQAEHKACWASICVAVVSALRPNTPQKTPTNLYIEWENATGKGGQDPQKVLKDEYKIDCTVEKFEGPVNGGDAIARALKMKEVIVNALKNGTPVICGMTTHDDAPVGFTVTEPHQPVPWQHATLAFKCDTDLDLCWIRDPAPGGKNAADAERSFTFTQLSTGFDYMDKSNFGEKTKAMLGEGAAVGILKARVFKCIVPIKK